ncbi:hypothetical protein [Mucilaginibacter sp. JRF]|uniref:hypothetical protein n=1 Tax=Mucilaginibacter sp. JRF TaxID=2780088 RepID=UPI001D16BE1B|nr:hypothetical protein [Mucilaginibacter sp. JRF]
MVEKSLLVSSSCWRPYIQVLVKLRETSFFLMPNRAPLFNRYAVPSAVLLMEPDEV